MSFWDGFVDEFDLETYRLAGFGREGTLGTRPALLIIDVQHLSLGPRLPLREAIAASYPSACGEIGWAAVDQLRRVLTAARGRGIPVIYPIVAPRDAAHLGRYREKIPAMAVIDEQGYQIVDEVAPKDGDLLLPKTHPSAFNGTSLTSLLIERGIDTVLVTGNSTSGCVRATTTDAFSLNLHAAVIGDAVYDRGRASHAVNLFDLASKYANVITSDEAIDYLGRLPA
jgi:maleamate amidohydrolase